MKADLLKRIVNEMGDDEEVVIQTNHGEYFSFHDFKIWSDGHIGHSGPIIMLGPTIDLGVAASTATSPGGES